MMHHRLTDLAATFLLRRKICFGLPTLRLSSLVGLLSTAGLLLATTPSLAAPALLTAKAVSKSLVEPGEHFTYQIRYRCASLTEHCLNTQIVDAVPAALTIVSFTQASGQVAAANDSGNTITWDLASLGSPAGQLDAGSTGIVSVRVRFRSCGDGTTAGTYTNTGFLSASNATTSNASVDITLNTSVPACPPPQLPNGNLVKSIIANPSIGGFIEMSFFLPDSPTSYTLTDELEPWFVPVRIKAEVNATLEIQCNNSGIWRDLGSETLNEPSDLDPSWTECVATPHPDPVIFAGFTDYPSGTYFYNVTDSRWTVAANGPSSIRESLDGMYLDENPFNPASDLADFEPVQANSTVENCIQSSDLTMSNNGEECHARTVTQYGPDPDLLKFLNGSPTDPYPSSGEPSLPLDATTVPSRTMGSPNDLAWTVVVQSDKYSTGPWADPVVVDILDPNLRFVEGVNWWYVQILDNSQITSVADAFDNPDCWNPELAVVENAGGSGQQALVWDFEGCTVYQMDQSVEILLHYSTQILPGTPAGTTVTNAALALLPEADGGGCHDANGNLWPPDFDIDDLDNDLDVTERVCRRVFDDYTIGALAFMGSSKWALGKLDTELSRFPVIGDTDLSGEGIYQLVIENDGNVDISRFDVIDILPHVGDEDVLNILGARSSEWAEELRDPLVVERYDAATASWLDASSDLSFGPLYSTSLEPCRFENAVPTGDDLTINEALDVGPAGCDPDPWTGATTSTAAGARSFGFRFEPSVALAPGDKLRVTASIRLSGNPPGCTTVDCSAPGDVLENQAAAWNSFAFGGIYDASGVPTNLLDTEPVKVGLRMIDTVSFTSLGNRVWSDTDGDGIQDAGEPGIAGVLVTLYAADGTTQLGQELTDSNGYYRFDGLDPSTTFVVRLDNPIDYNGGVLGGLSLSPANQGVTDLADSDATLNASGFAEITTATGPVLGAESAFEPTEYPSNDFGFFESNTVGDRVWYDLDGFGDQSFGEPGVEGATARLYSTGTDGAIGGGDDVLVATTTTDANGSYRFEDVPNGAYYVQLDSSTITGDDPVTGTAVDPADWIFTISFATGNTTNDSDADSSSGNTDVVTLTGGQDYLTLDAGLAPAPTTPVSLGDFVWLDLDGDGIQDAGEPGLEGITVQLLDVNELPVGTTQTDVDGFYEFSNLAKNDFFQVQVILSNPALQVTLQDQGGDDALDSDVDPTSGATPVFQLTPTSPVTHVPTWDIGLVGVLDFGDLAAPYDTLFADGGPAHVVDSVNYLGASVDSETDGQPTAGADGDGADEDGVAAVDLNQWVEGTDGGAVAIEVTGSGYLVGWIDWNRDGDFDDAGEMVVSQPASSETVMASFDIPAGSLAGTTELGARFRLFAEAPSIPTLASTGLAVGGEVEDYIFTFARSSIGDRVWLDVDGDGVQDIGEPGLSGVTAELWLDDGDGIFNSGTDTLVTTTVTDASGNYLFDGLAADNYFVNIDDTTLPPNLTTSPGTSDPSALVSLAANEAREDVDFGYVPDSGTAAIGDFVWADADADGVQDPGEIGLAGVVMALVSDPGIDGTYGTADDVVAATMVTAIDGTYLFTNVAPGNYVVVADVGVDGIPANGDETLISAAYTPTFGPQSPGGFLSEPVTVLADDVYVEADFGFDNAALHSISDTLWQDMDDDGVLDAGEKGIPGVTVNLLDASGDVVATVVTDENGDFLFAGLVDGNYTLEVSDLDGVLSLWGATTPAAGAGSLAVMVSGFDLNGENFGYVSLGTIGDVIWSDADANGVQDPGEVGIGGVTVDLIDIGPDLLPGTADDAVVATDTTEPDGSYLFTALGGGQYIVKVTDTASALAAYTQVFDRDGQLDGETAGAIAQGESDPTFDFGFQQATLADISGTVFNDLDADSVEEAGEAGIGGVTVDLLDALGNVIATTTTDASGNYTFPDLPDGDYRVAVTDVGKILDGYSLTSGLDVLAVTVAGSDVSDVDFGYVRNAATGSIGDSVFLDADRDGMEGVDEPGIGGVTVDLFDAGPDGLAGTGDDTFVATTSTDVNGGYRFSNLEAGFYYVDVTDTGGVLTGLGLTAGSDPSVLIALAEGASYDDADFGYAPAAGSALGDTVWYDADGDGLQDAGEVGIAGVTVTVEGPSGPIVVVTGADGRWFVPGLAPGLYGVTVDTSTLPAGLSTTPTNADISYLLTVDAGSDYYHLDWGFNGGTTGSIGDTVFLDADADGVLDASESGLAGVTLNLLDGLGNVIATTTTAADGSYDFVGLLAGDYTLEVTDVGGVLDGLNVSTPPVGTIMLAAGQDYDLADYGYAPSGGTGSIGSQVWWDLDGDGVLDAGESGMQGVTLDLWLDVDGDGMITPGIDNLLRTVATDANGEYELNGLPADDYIVQVTDTAGVLTGFTHTLGTPGEDGNSQLETYPVTLTPGVPNNPTADFGYFLGSGSTISGTVFEDDDESGSHDEPGEPVVPGVTVNLYRVVGGSPELIGTTVADASGNYSFDDLPDGDYAVEVLTDGSAVDGWDQTTQNATGGIELVTLAGADSTDNDFGFFDGGVVTNPVTLASFEASGTSFTWTTATESGNVGFHLWTWDAASGDWQVLNESIIPSRAVFASVPQHYEFDAGGAYDGPFVVEDLDLHGKSRFHGPFDYGHRFGHQVDQLPIDWLAVRAEHESVARARSMAKAETKGAELRVSRTGLHRVYYQQLLEAGVELAGVKKRHLALLGPDGPVAMRVVSHGQFFQPGGWIEFLGEARDSLYTTTNVYRLIVDHLLALRPAVDRKPASPGTAAPSFHLETLVVGEDRHYSFGSPNGDPWFDAQLLAITGPVETSYDFALDRYLPSVASPELRVEVWGVTDWPAAPDHHVEVSVNGTVAAAAVFDGLSPRVLTATLSGLAGDGTDRLTVRLPHDTGVGFDLVHVEGFSITYPRSVVASDGRLRFVSAGETVEVGGMQNHKTVVYRQEDGRLTLVKRKQTTLEAAGYRLRFRGTGTPATYWVSEVGALLSPEIRPGRPATDLLDQQAELLVIAHPDFVAGVEPLVAARRDEGLTARVVDLEDVFAAYAGGVFDPEAIRSYVTDAHAQIGTRYLLLVGSDSYDYLDHLGLGAISFVPTLYGATDDIVSFAPIDTRFGDVDGDNVPEVAVGRLPVRTAAELDAVVAKTLAYPAMAAEKSAVFAADRYDAANAYSFTADSESMTSSLPASWLLTRSYIDQLGLENARQLLLDTLNAGVSLASFFGHSGPTAWSFSGLFTATDAAELHNAGRPMVVTQWGCWNTYYVSPRDETMGHQLMAGGDQGFTHGAAAVLGASTLTSAESERELALRLMPRLFDHGENLGDAIVAAKRALADELGTENMLDVLLGWNLLGDPTLRLTPTSESP